MQLSNRPRMRVIKLRKSIVALALEKPKEKQSRASKSKAIEILESAKCQPATRSKTSHKVSKDSLQTGAQLYSDIKVIFKSKNAKKLRTKIILDTLSAMGNKPWATICNGKAIDARKLASLLKPYGIHSKDLRFENGQAYKGYMRKWFAGKASDKCVRRKNENRYTENPCTA